MKRLVVVCPFAPDQAPGQRLKFEQYYEHWRRAGYDVLVRSFWSRGAWNTIYQRGRWASKVGMFLAGIARRLWSLPTVLRADLVYLFLEALPIGPPIVERLIVACGVPYVYDIDDLVYLPHASRSNPFMAHLRSTKKFDYLIRNARHVIVCTEHLHKVAAQLNARVTLISSTINTEVYSPPTRRTTAGRLTIGWSGSHSTSPYLTLLRDVLIRVQRSHGIGVLAIGDDDFKMEGVDVETLPWRLETEVEDLSRIDIGVYPLPDEEWVLGKSGLKALQYMALGIPTVAQAVGANLRIISHGVNGLLASTEEDWYQALVTLIEQPELRARLGAEARRTVVSRYSVAANAHLYLSALQDALSDQPGPPAESKGMSPQMRQGMA